MWTPLLRPGLGLLTGSRPLLRGFAQELAHTAVRQGTVLWCDGDHGFDPYEFAELNLVRGEPADAHADRLLVKRCMTPFQWHTVLTKHLDTKIPEADAALVMAVPFDRLFSTDELADWEQEDHLRHSLSHLRTLARRHRIPVLAVVDVARWWRTHPTLAHLAVEAAHHKWTVTFPGRWHVAGEEVVDPMRQATLWDFERTEVVSRHFHPSPARSQKLRPRHG